MLYSARMTQISYIVAVDNQSHRLDALLQSLRAQEEDLSCEYVFVDDGSTDGSFEALIEKTRRWPRTLLIQQRRQGPAAAMLAGAKAATGDAWLFLDGDAVSAPWAAQAMFGALRGGTVDLVLATEAVCPAPEAFDFGEPPAADDLERMPDALYDLLDAMPPPRGRILVRRSLFRGADFFVPGTAAPEFLPSLAAAAGGGVVRLNRPAFAVRPDDPSRVRLAAGQAERAFSAAVLAFLATHQDLPPRCRRVALLGALRRAWKQARARRHAGLTARFFWLYIKALLGGAGNVATTLADSLSAWDDAPLRRSAAGN
jgi:glycosyltransferase involved in cell wall biosynthesis